MRWLDGQLNSVLGSQLGGRPSDQLSDQLDAVEMLSDHTGSKTGVLLTKWRELV